MKLSSIFFLTENRAEFILKKQGDKLSAVENIDANEVLIKLQEADPSGNKQYLQWLVNQYLKKQFRLEDASRVRSELEQFESIKNRIEHRDINRYDYYKLGDLLQSIFGKDIELDIDISDPELDVLYDGPLGLLVVPKTKAASCKVGSGTKWCTAARENNKFDRYNKSGPLYIWKDKSGEKYQFHFENMQFMDAQDRPIDDNIFQQMRTRHPILSKLFKQYEQQILHSGNEFKMLLWAIHIIKDRWLEAEPTIMRDSQSAYYYTRTITKNRWPEAEPTLKKDKKHWTLYKNLFNITD